MLNFYSRENWWFSEIIFFLNNIQILSTKAIFSCFVQSLFTLVSKTKYKHFIVYTKAWCGKFAKWMSFTKLKFRRSFCWIGFKLNWFKSYDTNAKNPQKMLKTKETYITHMRIFLQNWKKNMEIVTYCVITFVLNLFNPSKWPSELQLCEKYSCRWRKNGLKWSENGHLSVTNFGHQAL